MKKYLAEMFGTMVLVLMGCGAAVSLGCNNGAPAAVVGTAMAFGLSVVAMAYIIGSISGCHINPAVSFGMFLSKRMSARECGMYVAFQVIGGLLGAVILYIITSSTGIVGIGANDLQNYGDGTITLAGGFLAEMFFTCVFVLVVLGVTAKTNGATTKFAGLVMGLSLTLVHLACIRYTGTSVNPARSIGPALFQGGTALHNLWIFIFAPACGAALAAWVWKVIDPATAEK